MFTACLLCFIYILKGVYPFGTNNIAYYDMNQSFIPLYTHAWDVLHFKAVPYYGWFTACSSNMYANMGAFVLSPLNLFFLFVKRDDILNAMSFFLMFKMMLMSFTMSLYLKKTHAADGAVTTAAALMYTFGGYVMQYYTNIYFLEAMVFLPLIMLCLKRMFDTGKGLLYMAVTALTVISCPYLSLMILMFLVFFGFGYIHITNCGSKKAKISALGLYTALALGISLFVLAPAMWKWSSSVRLNEVSNPDYSEIIFSAKQVETGIKAFMFFGCEAGVAALVTAMAALKKGFAEKRQTLFYLYLILLLAIPVFLPSTELMWHFGSHINFPFRFGFILSFVSADIFVWFSSKTKSARMSGKAAAVAVLLFPVGLALLAAMCANFLNYGIFNVNGYGLYLPCFAVYVVFYIVWFNIRGRAKNTVLYLCVFLSCAAAGWGFVSPKYYCGDEAEHTTITGDMYIKESVALKKELEFDNDNISRMKCVYPMLSTNYPVILERAGLSAWLNENNVEYFETMRSLGYGSVYTRIIDVGGTAFTDALLNVKKVMSKKGADEALYVREQSVNGIDVYDCRFKLPFGIPVGHSFTEMPKDSGFEWQNRIYAALSGDEQPLIYTLDNNAFGGAKDENGMFVYSAVIPIKGEFTLYAVSDGGVNDAYSFALNGKVKEFGYFENTEVSYPKDYISGFAELGTFKDENAEVAVLTSDEGLKHIRFGLMDDAKLDALTAAYADKGAENVYVGKDRITMSVDADGGNYAFIPVEYSADWKAAVNGVKTDTVPVLGGAFMAVPLQNGVCDIKLVYVPKLMLKSVLALVAALAAAVLVTLLKMRKNVDIAENKFFKNLAYAVFNITAAGMLCAFYVIPAAAALITAVKSWL